MPDDSFHVFDTTLRDGAQREGVTLTVADKLAIAGLLDEFGVGFIEGGWPGANPKDTEFFQRASQELDLEHAQLTAFGATRRPGARAADDPQVAALRESGAPVVTLVAKSDIRHVERALRTTGEENLAMIADTVAHLKECGRRVFLDCEHFFDGYRYDPGYALDVVRAAGAAGADAVVLCDINGGMLPPGGVRTGIRGRLRDQCAVHCYRIRRAGQQRQPVLRGGGPRARVRPPRAAAGAPGRGLSGLRGHRRAGQQRPHNPPALRRRLGVRA